MSRPKYRVHVWKGRSWGFRGREWLAAVWEDGGPVIFRGGAPVGFSTHAEAVAAGLEWANKLNAREKE